MMNIARRGVTGAQWRRPALDALMCRMCVPRAYSIASVGVEGAPASESNRLAEQPSVFGKLLREIPSLFPNLETAGARRGTVVTTPYGMLTGRDVALTQSSSAELQLENDAISTNNADVGSLGSLLGESLLLVKRTFQPSLIRRKRKHGFLKRIRTKDGRKILNARRRKGRSNLCA